MARARATLAATVEQGLRERFDIQERVPGGGSNALGWPARRNCRSSSSSGACPSITCWWTRAIWAATEAILLDPVTTGKLMAGSIDLVREGRFKAGENGPFLHTGGAPSWPASEPQVLARVPVAD